METIEDLENAIPFKLRYNPVLRKYFDDLCHRFRYIIPEIPKSELQPNIEDELFETKGRFLLFARKNREDFFYQLLLYCAGIHLTIDMLLDIDWPLTRGPGTNDSYQKYVAKFNKDIHNAIDIARSRRQYFLEFKKMRKVGYRYKPVLDYLSKLFGCLHSMEKGVRVEYPLQVMKNHLARKMRDEGVIVSYRLNELKYG